MADMFVPTVMDAELPRAQLGESPLWHAETNSLYWVDIEEKKLHHYQIGERQHHVTHLPQKIGFVALAETGMLLAGLEDGLYTIDPTKGTAHLAVPHQPAISYLRFNDGAVDRRGRVYAGTMRDDKTAASAGALYTLNDNRLELIEPDVPTSNGLAWNPASDRLYHADTKRQTVWQYDYDHDTGRPSHRRVFVTFEHEVSPDGLCMDAAGRVYVALFRGGRIERYSPDGKLDRVFPLPVAHVTSCAFGGPDLKTLYVTTARDDMHDLSGYVFQMTMDTPGLHETPAALHV